MSDPDFFVYLGGTGITAATIKAIQENMAETELGSEQGRGQKEGGQKELKQDIRSLVQRGQKRRKGRKRTCRQATGKTHRGPPSVKELASQAIHPARPRNLRLFIP